MRQIFLTFILGMIAQAALTVAVDRFYHVPPSFVQQVGCFLVYGTALMVLLAAERQGGAAKK